MRHFVYPKCDFEYSEISRGGKTISIINIPQSPNKPHTFQDKCYLFKNNEVKLANLEEEESCRHEAACSKRTETGTNSSKNNFTSDEYIHVSSPSISRNVKETQNITFSEPVVIEKNETQLEPAYNTTDSAYPHMVNALSNFESIDEFIVHLNKRQKKALKYLKENKSIRNKVYRKIGDVSHKTAHIELTEMLQYGLIRSQGSGRSTHYILNV